MVTVIYKDKTIYRLKKTMADFDAIVFFILMHCYIGYILCRLRRKRVVCVGGIANRIEK